MAAPKSGLLSPQAARSPRNGGSYLSESLATPATAAALSFVDPDVSRPINLLQDSAVRSATLQEGPSLAVRALVVCLGLYCTPAVTLFQQHYKDVQRSAGGDGCRQLWAKVADGLRGAPFAQLANPRTPAPDLADVGGAVAKAAAAPGDARRATGDWAASLGSYWTSGRQMVHVSRETAGPDGIYFDEALQHRECPWYLVEVESSQRKAFAWHEGEQEHCGASGLRDREVCESRLGCVFFQGDAEGPGCYMADCLPGSGRVCYRRAIHTYDKGFSLFLESICAMLVHWTWAYCAGGTEMLKSCFDISKMRRFAVIGFLFGFSSVFAFLAQAKLTPGSYLIIGQASIIIVPIMWRLTFRTPIPLLSWTHIVAATLGIYMYFLADLEWGSGSDSLIGVMYAFTKVCMAAIAAVNTDKYLKTLKDIPFTVQVSYILPFKTCACLATTFMLPPHGFPPAAYRPSGAFHDMNWVVLVILVHSLGSTIATACVVKVFDSVAKALIGVISIIFPTWVVSYAIGWDTIEWNTDKGRLKVSGGLIVIIMAVAYVLGRSQAAALSTKIDQLAEIDEWRRRLERPSEADSVDCKLVWEPGPQRKQQPLFVEMQPQHKRQSA